MIFESHDPAHQRALVTLALGDDFQRFWARTCRSGWLRYAQKHHYDLICFTEPLDESMRARARSPSWQKCLIPDHPLCRGYERLVWLDADIAINPHSAPCLVAQVPEGKIGGTDAYAFLSRDMHDHLYEAYLRMAPAMGRAPVVCRTPAEYYRAFGIENDLDDVIQCGLLVMTPELHREPFRACYERYDEKVDAHGYRFNLEMRPLSYEIVSRGLHHFIDQRFNLILSNFLYLSAPWLFHSKAPALQRKLAVTCAYAHAYALHFAGGASFRAFAEDLIEGIEAPEDFEGFF